ncbi:hypothetical protein BKA56DRAFT_598956 [Ilyonectria sp. MPI-CAGE-AT-0026]|nr:hypothetical protein BKA56DRAFT_598956 [Ilyonectria sp. MPI-CAGE-AT-0026]
MESLGLFLHVLASGVFCRRWPEARGALVWRRGLQASLFATAAADQRSQASWPWDRQ